MLFSSASKKPARVAHARGPSAPPALLGRAITQAFAGSVLLAAFAPALANPSGESVTQGRATFDRRTPGVLNVRTQTANTAIHWQQFSIARGERTHFEQPNAASTVVNRVVQPNPSTILGTLTSNGQVVLVNPSGIAFGRGASVDTAGFTAATIDLGAGNVAPRAAITVEGTIRSRHGDVVLLASDVRLTSDARLEADQGSVVLAAAGPRWLLATRLRLGDRELDNVVFELQPDKLARALEDVPAGGAALFTGSLQHSGLIVAKEASRNQAGKVVLLGGSIERPGRIEQDNGLRVNGAAAAELPPSPPTPAPGPQSPPRPAPSPAGSVDRMTQAAAGAATRAEMRAAVAELDGATLAAGIPGKGAQDQPRGRRDRGAPSDAEMTCRPEGQ